MNEGLLMGLDLGGSGVRCVLVDVADASVVSAVAPWRPSPAADVPLGHAYAPEATWEGHWPHPIQAACRLRWCAEQTPQLLDAAHTHLAISDWLAFRLSGEIATEASQACETALLEVGRARWSEEMIDALELPRRLFPELRAAGSRLGSLRADAAEALGLPEGIPVAVAGAR